MKYIANPVVVDAVQITRVCPPLPSGHVGLHTDAPVNRGGDSFLLATPEMLARFTPGVGDYIVKQADGYVYLNPREVFERKYTARP